MYTPSQALRSCWHTMKEEESGTVDTQFSHMEDDALLQHIRHGKHEAFEALVTRHARRFYGTAYRLVFDKNDAEDIVQEAFHKLWQKPERWNPDKQTRFTTWFYKIVTNLCVDYNRKRRPIAMPENMPFMDHQPGQEMLLLQKQKQALLDGYIQKLPIRQQLALNLCFYEGLSNKEMEDVLSISYHTVKNHIYNIFQKLGVKSRGQLIHRILQAQNGGMPG